MRISDWSSDVCSSDLPAFAEAFPRQQRRLARSEQRPHRHFHRAGIRAGNDADQVRVWHLQDFAGEIDRALQPGLADLGAVRAAKRFRRSEEHTSEIQSLMRISYAVFCLKKKHK